MRQDALLPLWDTPWRSDYLVQETVMVVEFLSPSHPLAVLDAQVRKVQVLTTHQVSTEFPEVHQWLSEECDPDYEHNHHCMYVHGVGLDTRDIWMTGSQEKLN